MWNIGGIMLTDATKNYTTNSFKQHWKCVINYKVNSFDLDPNQLENKKYVFTYKLCWYKTQSSFCNCPMLVSFNKALKWEQKTIL